MALSDAEVLENLREARDKCVTALATGRGKTIEWEYGGQRQKSESSTAFLNNLLDLISVFENKTGDTSFDRSPAVVRPRGPY